MLPENLPKIHPIILAYVIVKLFFVDGSKGVITYHYTAFSHSERYWKDIYPCINVNRNDLIHNKKLHVSRRYVHKFRRFIHGGTKVIRVDQIKNKLPGTIQIDRGLKG